MFFETNIMEQEFLFEKFIAKFIGQIHVRMSMKLSAVSGSRP